VKVSEQDEPNKTASVMLVGRDPKALQLAGQKVTEAMGVIDAHLYERALSDRADGAGIGAMAYMRRVVENEMNRLLDLLIELLSADAEKVEQLQRAKELRNENRFSEKAEAADAVLPPTFFPGNQNPFSNLHKLCSEGVHELDDFESCGRFDDGKELFELLFMRLLHEREGRRLYDEKAKRLVLRKGPGGR